jgi:PleD family two-component response regulator
MTKVWLGGRWSDAVDLRTELAAHGSLASVDDLHAADAIVHLTDGAQLREELAQMREHSQAPIVLVAERAGAELLDTAFEADVAASRLPGRRRS